MSKHKKPTKKKVSIIVPFYGQTESELAVPLASINNQIGIDFSAIDVHLVNDGGAPIDSSKFDIFENLDLHYHELLENVGPGLARQYGIDHSEGEYVMFVDSDDTLNALDALAGFFMAIEQLGNHQVIAANYVFQEKSSQAGNHFSYRTFTPETPDYNTVVYGRWYSRAFLRKYGLRFTPQLRNLLEDTYFGELAAQLAEDSIMTNQTPYLRRYNTQSLTQLSGYYDAIPLDKGVFMNRLKLEKIQEVKPAALDESLEKALVSIYLSFENYQMTDEVNFWKELHQLLAEFPYDFEKNFSKLSLLVAASKSHKAGAEHLKEFLDKTKRKTT